MNKDNDFINEIKKIDFSDESENKEKNLEILKSKINNYHEEEIFMKKKFRPLALVGVISAVLCLSAAAVYGQDLYRIIRSISIGDHANYSEIEMPEPDWTIPEKFKGQIFDKDGNELESFEGVDRIYNENGEAMNITLVDNEQVLVTVGESENMIDYVTFTDLKEGKSHFITDILEPSYLPAGYEFKNVQFYAKNESEIGTAEGANKYMNINYVRGGEELTVMLRFMDEETAYEAGMDASTVQTTINGHDAVVSDNNVDIQIGDVMYMFFGNDSIDKTELVKMAESLK